MKKLIGLVVVLMVTASAVFSLPPTGTGCSSDGYACEAAARASRRACQLRGPCAYLGLCSGCDDQFSYDTDMCNILYGCVFDGEPPVY